MLRLSRSLTRALLCVGLCLLLVHTALAHPDSKAGGRHKIKYKFYGKIESMDGKRWVVAGHPIRITDLTEIEYELSVGDHVKAKVFESADNSWVATEIEPEDDDETGMEIKITAYVQSIEGSVWTLAGQTFEISDDTAMEYEIEKGDRVKIEAEWRNADGHWVALEVEWKPISWWKMN